jgi:FMN phosphatase YigB (HAD superfamily)
MPVRYPVVSFDLDRTLIFHAKGSKQEEVVGLLNRQGVAATVGGYRQAAQVAREFYDVLGYSYGGDAVQLRSDYVRLIVELLGCKDPDVVCSVADHYREYDEEPANFFVPPAARSLLSLLLVRGVQLVAVSSNLAAAQRLRHCGIADVFDALFTPALGAPKAALFSLLPQQLGCRPSAILHIGDDPILDVLAPRRAGLDAVLFDPEYKYADLAWTTVVRSYAGLEPLLV